MLQQQHIPKQHSLICLRFLLAPLPFARLSISFIYTFLTTEALCQLDAFLASSSLCTCATCITVDTRPNLKDVYAALCVNCNQITCVLQCDAVARQAEVHGHLSRKPRRAGRTHRLDKPLEGGSVHFGTWIAQPGQPSAGHALT